ncbi:MFS transporter [Aerosticca soli]|jgi:MFS family permease|uniref:Sialic acid transporter NanT n=1 Tax=Aerosticca soli TaxID=2010829 RepID=A0A2Z6E5Q7_9GAMM|nr:MFS transporter [Aerosticca soli]BBD80081.1 sialic acid transporter NanT [Aerosticca soli]
MQWFKELKPAERHAFVAAFGGWALDALDFMVFTFVISTLITLWGIDRGQAGMLGTVTLLFSAVGGWCAGILADRYGRVRVLQFTILWFSVCTVLIGFSQNFTQIFVLRALQGLGFGGEWAVGSVLMGEIVRSEFRGRAVGTVQSGWAIGWALAALLYGLAFSLLPEQVAWRSLFWFGVLPALLVLYVRRKVPEPAIFAETQRLRATRTVRFTEIFAPDLLRTTALASLLCTGVQGGYYAITTWLPTFLKSERHLSVLGTSGYLAVVILGSFLGYLGGAWLTDRFGRRANLIVFALLSGASLYLYTQLPLSDTLMLVLGFPLGFAASGIFSGLGAYLTELYPSRVRASGQGFAYNFGRGIGALFPTLVGYLSERGGLGMAIGVFAGGAYLVVILTVLLLPETRGRELHGWD